MLPVVCPAYLPNIYYVAWVLKQKTVLFDRSGNYQKQTYRNRATIYGANGKLTLTVPVTHTKNGRQRDDEVCVHNDFYWQKQHWKSITTAYRSAPFFEFYEDDLAPFFEKPQQQLFAFNLNLLEKICALLGETLHYETVVFDKNFHLRKESLINAKREVEIQIPPYTQVFEAKHEFLSNLSIIDLLFNKGSESVPYLQSLSL